jgi:signal peptidase I
MARKDQSPPPAHDEVDAPGGSQFRAIRETIESIVVAFVLAFLFRTFEAEAFVIPTGSMSPSLLGQHKDVECPQCGHRYRVSASSEETDQVQAFRQRLKHGMQPTRLRGGGVAMRPLDPGTRRELERQVASFDIVGGMCPMCRYLAPYRRDLPLSVQSQVDLDDVENQPSYPGDRILVNKYGFAMSEPQRWDVVVFKFPGNGNMNYIKRLVGLPGESLQIYQGDLFARPLDASDAPYQILRKPPAKVAAMLQLVHDTQYDPVSLFEAGWPLRWAATTPQGWQVTTEAGQQTVRQKFVLDGSQAAGQTAWLRYRHMIPSVDDWQIVRSVNKTGSFEEIQRRERVTREDWQASWRASLINDFNPYNARLQRNFAETDGWRIVPSQRANGSGSLGTQWVSDLALECDVQVDAAQGQLLLDLVEAGYHFRASIELSSGKVGLSVVDGRTDKVLPFAAEGQTPIKSPGTYHVRLANVDDQLLVWVDDKLIDCGDCTYDPDTLLGGRRGLIPWTSEGQQGDQGDLAPVGVGGSEGAKLTVDRLAVYRDIYYIATKYNPKVASADSDSQHATDYPFPTQRVQLEDRTVLPGVSDFQELFAVPQAWPRFLLRQKRSFPIASEQFFVMGDNSPESQDCRLWLHSGKDSMGQYSGRPGGSYLDRRLLIGEAVCVFWPHSWGGVPGVEKLPGFPNFGDMRLVR